MMGQNTHTVEIQLIKENILKLYLVTVPIKKRF